MRPWTLLELVLKGQPWEVMPEDLPRVMAAAWRSSEDARLTDEERDRIARVWLADEEVAA